MWTAIGTQPPRMWTAIGTRRFAGNYFSTMLFIALAYGLITHVSNFHQQTLQAQWDLASLGIEGSISVQHVYLSLIAVYAAVLVPYYAHYSWLRSKSFVFLRGVWMGLQRKKTRGSFVSTTASRARGLDTRVVSPLLPWLSLKTKQASLSLLLKFYFAPLMLNWCLLHVGDMTTSLFNTREGIEAGFPLRVLFDSSLYWSLFQLILFVDTLLFTIGYLIEMPALRNRIRSVEPTFFGWFICLASYPPFNEFTGRYLPWQSSDFPHLEHDALHFGVNIMLLLSLAIFSWASVALGFKASNLTNRGIVTHGPYAFVRHPAYAAKTFAWLLGALPAIAVAFANGWRDCLYVIAVFGGWTAIYILRALTEERHLLMLDNGYAQYMRNVPYRFIPRVI
jgi:protein-S-isoprenylcysteine O-methyltransferase Ste14